MNKEQRSHLTAGLILIVLVAVISSAVGIAVSCLAIWASHILGVSAWLLAGAFWIVYLCIYIWKFYQICNWFDLIIYRLALYIESET